MQQVQLGRLDIPGWQAVLVRRVFSATDGVCYLACDRICGLDHSNNEIPSADRVLASDILCWRFSNMPEHHDITTRNREQYHQNSLDKTTWRQDSARDSGFPWPLGLKLFTPHTTSAHFGYCLRRNHHISNKTNILHTISSWNLPISTPLAQPAATST